MTFIKNFWRDIKNWWKNKIYLVQQLTCGGDTERTLTIPHSSSFPFLHSSRTYKNVIILITNKERLCSLAHSFGDETETWQLTPSHFCKRRFRLVQCRNCWHGPSHPFGKALWRHQKLIASSMGHFLRYYGPVRKLCRSSMVRYTQTHSTRVCTYLTNWVTSKYGASDI